MGASFRSIGEITELAGCDYLTISVSSPSKVENLKANTNFQPNLLEELMGSSDPVPQKLNAATASALDIEKKSYIDNEPHFRFDFNEDAMGVEKLREGISKFAADAVTLKELLKKKIEA